MRFSPRLDPLVVATVRRMDVDRVSIAEAWRAAGDLASQLGVARPGYHSVLKIVLAERNRRAQQREAIVEAVDEMWSHTGMDYEKLVGRLAEAKRR